MLYLFPLYGFTSRSIYSIRHLLLTARKSLFPIIANLFLERKGGKCYLVIFHFYQLQHNIFLQTVEKEIYRIFFVHDGKLMFTCVPLQIGKTHDLKKGQKKYLADF